MNAQTFSMKHKLNEHNQPQPKEREKTSDVLSETNNYETNKKSLIILIYPIRVVPTGRGGESLCHQFDTKTPAQLPPSPHTTANSPSPTGCTHYYHPEAGHS